jgi:low temperature requirement protein LtrA
VTRDRIRVGFLRERRADEAAARPIETFFDLVYVLAVTQLTHYLLEHLSVRGAVETLLLLAIVWLGWIHVIWITNYFHLGTLPVRLMLIALMLTALIMSAVIPEAFDDRGLAFAIAISLILVASSACIFALIGGDHHLGPVIERVVIWWSIVAAVLIAGGVVDGDARFAVWLGAMAVAYTVMWHGFPVPWIGRSVTTDYTIIPRHIAERCTLFITLALGESILITGSNFGELPSSVATVAAFVTAFVSTVALWWIYFDRAVFTVQAMEESSDPGRIALLGHTYLHIPMVAGVIAVAAGDELAIAHPSDPVSTATAAVILGGPAVYLAGQALFRRTVFDRIQRSRIVGLAGVAALVPLAVAEVSTLALLVAATAVIVAIAAYDTWATRRPDAVLLPAW